MDFIMKLIKLIFLTTEQRKEPSTKDKCILLANKLLLKKIKYEPNVSKNIYISTLYKTADVYIKSLIKINSIILNKQYFDDNLISEKLIITNIDSWLISADGYYLDPEKTIKELCNVVIMFLDKINDNITTDIGIYPYYLRMTKHIIDNIYGLLDNLDNATN